MGFLVEKTQVDRRIKNKMQDSKCWLILVVKNKNIGLKNRAKWFRKENVGKESKYRCSAKEQKWKYSSWRMNKIRDEK